MREFRSDSDAVCVPMRSVLATLGIVTFSTLALHPSVSAPLAAMGVPVGAQTAVPVFAAVLAYLGLLRPGAARAKEESNMLLAERDGARAREHRLKDELQLTEDALTKAHKSLERAEEAAAAKTRYLSTVSHEVRTPLTGVIGMSELLSETDLNDEQSAFVGTVRSSADDLQSILSGVLDFSALETGELVLEDVPFDIREVAEEALFAEVPSARKKGLELVFDVPHGLMTQARGDPRRVRQMISVLLSNAVKFTDRGVIVMRLRGADRPSGAEMRVSVEDTGIGIADADRKRIFQPFTQGDTTSAERYGGTGLGLAIASKLAGMMSGRIEVDTLEGQGSTFTLRFAHRLRQTARAVQRRGPDLSGQRFLLIDDCAAAATVLDHQLTAWGGSVETVVATEDGEDALWASVADGPGFTAVFLDISLAGIDAPALAERFAARLVHLPVVLMTAQGLKSNVGASVGSMGTATLEKPFRQEDLERVLAHVAEARTDTLAMESDLAAEAIMPKASGLGAPGLTPACIVLADDNATNRTLIEKFLTDEPMTLIHAPDGVGAVEAFESWAPDLILMDVAMPRMDGLEATRRIRSTERAQGLAQVPIIALTARATAEDRAKCLEAGMDDYVAKPVRKSELKAKITQWTRLRQKSA